jgi:serine/threonine protein kinase
MESTIFPLDLSCLPIWGRWHGERERWCPRLNDVSRGADDVHVSSLVDGSPASSEEDVLSRGVAIGRYVVLGLVGRGAMGEVYAAYDPELNRKVAIKLLHANRRKSCDGTDRIRLMREAQSIARLSHPNVVVIHDVGAFRNNLFIAMEFVEGHTVGYWTQAQPRSWSEVLKIFVAAGNGLAAAHEKELVHRDFKPDNVMVSADGQVRVMDFGLARIAAKEDASARGEWHPIPIAAEALAGVEEGDLLSTRVIAATRARSSDELNVPAGPLQVRTLEAGAMLGTPAYMPPEEFDGYESDARGDQFSFCVAFYEALYGERPFRGKTVLELSANVTKGKVREAPIDTRVPMWIRKVLLRGLSVSPDDRWPSMKALLGQFDENARRLAEIDEWLAAREIS